MLARIPTKLQTSRRVLQQRGIVGVAIEGWTRLFPGKTRWRWEDHWWLGKLVELGGNRVRVEDCVFSLATSAIATPIKGRFLLDAYEKPERAALARFLNPRLPVVELGGCIGVISCLTNKRLANATAHVVVEANGDLIPILQQNRERNRCGFRVLHRAVGYDGPTVTFYQDASFISSSLKRPTSQHMEVPTIRLSDIVADQHWERITLLCDIEGTEVDLVQNELDCLANHVQWIMMETHPGITGAAAVDSMSQQLEQVGFRRIHDTNGLYVFENIRLGAS